MGTVIEINDILDELRNENKRLSKSICLTKKCFILLEKYKNCLNAYQSQCKCIDSKSDINSLEIEYKNTKNAIKQIADKSALNLSQSLDYDKYDNNHDLNYNQENEDFSHCMSSEESFNDLENESFNEIVIKSEENDINFEIDGYEDIQTLRPKRNVKKIKFDDNCVYNNDNNGCDINDNEKDSDFEYNESDDEPVPEVKPKAKPKKPGTRGFPAKYIYCSFPNCDFKTRYRQRSEEAIHKHINSIHKNKDPIKCLICEKEFYGLMYFRRHINKCSNGNPYVCDWPECKTKFKTKSLLASHKFGHTGEKPFKCDWPGCDAGFINKSCLSAHRITHSDVYDFPCDWPECEAKFKIKPHLELHQKIHTGEKPFVCDCGMSFINNAKLLRHLRTKKHNNSEYPCVWPECELKFDSEKKLKKHTKEHTSTVDMFQCNRSDCGLEFKSKKKLNKHLKEHENNSNID